MNLKGEKTKQAIREKAYQLFAEKGFKDVTMKDICGLTGLSRGGLYRHYESTEQIFLEIVNAFSNEQKSEISAKIEQHVPAATILEELLSKYAGEMTDDENSLSLAIYQFYSNPAISKEDNSVKKQYEISKSTWIELINYGIATREFNSVNPETIFNIHGEDIIYGSELFDKTESYEEWLSSVTLNTNPKTVNENWVVTDTFFAIRKRDDRIIGIIDLRHTLNEFLKDLQLLRVAKEAEKKELHISVERENAASIKVIQKNGGVYERSFSFEKETADIHKIEL